MPSDPLLGTLYIEPTDFITNAKAYGASKAVAALGADAQAVVTQAVALASRAIDAYCQRRGMAFTPNGSFSENHKFDFAKPFVVPNNPPVVDLLSFKIRTGVNTLTTFPLTPVSNGPDDQPTAWGSVYYNRQENYLELTAIQITGNWVYLISDTGVVPRISMGIAAQAEIKYRGRATVDPKVVAATGWQTAFLLNQTFMGNSEAPNVRSMSSPEFSMTFDNRLLEGAKSGADAIHAALSPMAIQVLQGAARRIPIA